MWTPAVLRFGLVVLVTACWGGAKPAAQPVDLEPSVHDPTGNYWCSIDDEAHLEFVCAIQRKGSTLHLVKANGSERIRGEIVVEGDHFSFAGERFCLFEDCTAKLHGTFTPSPGGGYKGTFKEQPIIVRLAPMPAGTVGGQAYGGDAYGVDGSPLPGR